jgi:hypothetical protein
MGLVGPSRSITRVARHPSIAANISERYVVGNNVLFDDEPVKLGETLTAWRIGQGSVGAPAGELVFFSPKGTLDSSGRLTLLWGEPHEHPEVIPPHQWPLLRIESAWSAAYEPSHGWTRPTLVYSGSIEWSRATTGLVTAESRDQALIAVPKQDGGVLVFVLRDGRWTVSPAAEDMRAAYVSVLGLESSRLLVVVAADTPHLGDTSGVFHDVNSVLLYRQLGQHEWKFWKRLQLSGEQPALEAKLVGGAGRRVHLVWRQMIREDSLVIRHIQSEDAGSSWSGSSDLTPRGLFQNLDAAADICGRLHVVYEDWSGGPSALRIGYATRDSAWSPPGLLHSSYTAGDLALVSQPDGSLFLSFLGTTGEARERRGWESFYSQFR